MVVDPKSDQTHLEEPKTKHLHDSQLRRPPRLKVRRDQRVWWPSAELLLRRIVSHDSNVNGHMSHMILLPRLPALPIIRACLVIRALAPRQRLDESILSNFLIQTFLAQGDLFRGLDLARGVLGCGTFASGFPVAKFEFSTRHHFLKI